MVRAREWAVIPGGALPEQEGCNESARAWDEHSWDEHSRERRHERERGIRSYLRTRAIVLVILAKSTLSIPDVAVSLDDLD